MAIITQGTGRSAGVQPRVPLSHHDLPSQNTGSKRLGPGAQYTSPMPLWPVFSMTLKWPMVVPTMKSRLPLVVQKELSLNDKA